MGYKAGKDMLLKVDFGLGAGFQTVGGIKTRRLTLGDTSVDATNQDSEGGWKEMVSGVASKSMKVSGDGIYKSGLISVQLQQSWLNQSAIGFPWQVIIPGLGTFEGLFAIGSLEYSGSQDELLGFSIELNSAGPIGFTPDTTV